jgi:hypothetical protein
MLPTIPASIVPEGVPASLSVPGGAGCNFTAVATPVAAPGQAVLRVGMGEPYQSIGVAVAAAANGDLILVQPGTYVNDFADITAQVTIAGAGGMVNLIATEAPPNDKGIFVVDSSCEIDNLCFQGAAIADSLGGNAAGIRDQGGNLVLHNDAFIGNQDGILAAAVDNLPQNEVTILHSTFDDNGQSTGPNAGYTHNCYISNGISSLVAQGDVFERANVGHELKSRAEANLISGNIFYDGPTGTASYSIDLPDGGNDTVSGNVIEKGPQAGNDALIHFGGEGIPYAGSALKVVGNRFVNDLGAPAVAVLNQTIETVSVTGNIFDDFAGATLASGPFVQSGNVDQGGHAIAGTNSSDFAPGTDLDDFSGDTIAHTLTLTNSTGVRGGGGLLRVETEAGHVTVVGGSGGLDFNEAPGFGGSLIATAAGAHDTIVALGQDDVESDGQDSITGGAGNLTVQVDGAAAIASGSGDNAYVVDGAAVITGHGGSDTVQLNTSGASADVTGREDYLQASINGGTLRLGISQGGVPEQATIIGGAAVKIYNGGMNVTTAGGTTGANIDFGDGSVTACFSAGPDTIHAGSGASDIIVSAGARVYAGAGALSVYGRSETGTATIYGAAGNVLISGDTGGVLYRGGGTGNTVQAALANISLVGGAGLMNVQGGSRQDVQGGTGGVIFTTSGGADVITTNVGAHDTISFAGACALISNGNDVVSAGGGNSTVTANGNARIDGSTGAAFYMLNGRDTMTANGYTRATVGASGNAAITAYGSLTALTDLGGRVVFSQMANADGESATVSGADISLTSASAADDTDITMAGAGNAQLGGGHEAVSIGGSARVQCGGGTDFIAVGGGGSVVQGGAGTLTISMNDWLDQHATTIFGGAGAVSQSNGYGNLIFSGGTGGANLGGVIGGETVAAGSGNITLDGGSTGTIFAGGSGNAVVNLTQGGGRVEFGTGVTTVTEAGWGSAVAYEFTGGSGDGLETIDGFRSGTDSLIFNNVVVVSQRVAGGALFLTLSDGAHVTLNGVTTLG